MIFSQETRSEVGVGSVVADAVVGTGELVACRAGRAVEGMMEVGCDETEDDVVGETITLVELATTTKETVT